MPAAPYAMARRIAFVVPCMTVCDTRDLSLLDDSAAAGAVDVSGGDLGVDDDDVPDWLKD